MTLQETLAHAREKAQGCDECAKEHKQLVEWLKIVARVERANVSKHLEEYAIIDYSDEYQIGYEEGFETGYAQALADIRGDKK